MNVGIDKEITSHGHSYMYKSNGKATNRKSIKRVSFSTSHHVQEFHKELTTLPTWKKNAEEETSTITRTESSSVSSTTVSTTSTKVVSTNLQSYHKASNLQPLSIRYFLSVSIFIFTSMDAFVHFDFFCNVIHLFLSSIPQDGLMDNPYLPMFNGGDDLLCNKNFSNHSSDNRKNEAEPLISHINTLLSMQPESIPTSAVQDSPPCGGESPDDFLACDQETSLNTSQNRGTLSSKDFLANLSQGMNESCNLDKSVFWHDGPDEVEDDVEDMDITRRVESNDRTKVVETAMDMTLADPKSRIGKPSNTFINKTIVFNKTGTDVMDISSSETAGVGQDVYKAYASLENNPPYGNNKTLFFEKTGADVMDVTMGDLNEQPSDTIKSCLFNKTRPDIPVKDRAVGMKTNVDARELFESVECNPFERAASDRTLYFNKTGADVMDITGKNVQDDQDIDACEPRGLRASDKTIHLNKTDVMAISVKGARENRGVDEFRTNDKTLHFNKTGADMMDVTTEDHHQSNQSSLKTSNLINQGSSVMEKGARREGSKLEVDCSEESTEKRRKIETKSCEIRPEETFADSNTRADPLSMDDDDVTSFMPPIESTRRIDFKIPQVQDEQKSQNEPMPVTASKEAVRDDIEGNVGEAQSSRGEILLDENQSMLKEVQRTLDKKSPSHTLCKAPESARQSKDDEPDVCLTEFEKCTATSTVTSSYVKECSLVSSANRSYHGNPHYHTVVTSTTTTSCKTLEKQIVCEGSPRTVHNQYAGIEAPINGQIDQGQRGHPWDLDASEEAPNLEDVSNPIINTLSEAFPKKETLNASRDQTLPEVVVPYLEPIVFRPVISSKRVNEEFENRCNEAIKRFAEVLKPKMKRPSESEISSDVEKVPPEKIAKPAVQDQSIFDKLKRNEISREERGVGDFKIIKESDVKYRLSFFSDSLQLLLSLGKPLPTATSDLKHWTVRKICFENPSDVLRSPTSLDIAKLVHRLLLYNMNHEWLEALCPTTLELEDTLSRISTVIEQGAELMLQLREIYYNHFLFTINNLTVTVGFSSLKLRRELLVDVELALGKEDKPRSVKLRQRFPELTDEEKIMALSRDCSPGWNFLPEFIFRLEEYWRNLESARA
jgi:hypothetical protein